MPLRTLLLVGERPPPFSPYTITVQTIIITSFTVILKFSYIIDCYILCLSTSKLQRTCQILKNKFYLTENYQIRSQIMGWKYIQLNESLIYLPMEVHWTQCVKVLYVGQYVTFLNPHTLRSYKLSEMRCAKTGWGENLSGDEVSYEE